MDGTMAAQFYMVLWAIWKQRNARQWEGSSASAVETVYTSSGYFIEWSAANYGARHRATAALQGGSGCDAWHVPPTRKWKGWTGIIEGDAKVVVDEIN
ncbi:hypothetical protein ACS0TY_001454 [Phlomoides rotata]